jgi:hypothetical protein
MGKLDMIYLVSDLVQESELQEDQVQTMALSLVDGICLKVVVDGSMVVLDPRLPYLKPDIASGHKGPEGDIGLVWDSERFNSRSAASSVVDRKTLPDVTAINQLFLVGFAGDDLYFHTRMRVKEVPSGVNHTHITSEDLYFARPRLWMSELSDAMAELVVRNKAKRTLLAQVKPEDSIAALEKQLDLLSTLLFKVINGEPVPVWAAMLKTAVEANSSTVQSGQAGAIEDLARHKAGIRALQATYFQNRNLEA